MEYSKKTDIYQIPYMGAGDVMLEEQNKIQMDIVDHLLYAATSGAEKFVLDEGTYSVEEVETDEVKTGYKIIVTKKTDEIYPISGMICRHAFVAVDSNNSNTFTINCNYIIGTYYVVLKYDGTSSSAVGCYSTNFLDSTAYVENDDDIVLGIFDASEGTFTENENNTYARNFVAHMEDSSDPHGSNLSQTSVTVSSSISLKGCTVPGAVFGTFITSGSSGSAVVSVSSSVTPKFVSVQPNSSAGDVYWSISSNTITFTNNGNSGITLSYKVDVL